MVYFLCVPYSIPWLLEVFLASSFIFRISVKTRPRNSCVCTLWTSHRQHIIIYHVHSVFSKINFLILNLMQLNAIDRHAFHNQMTDFFQT
jgi:hypothetical protein